MTGLDCLRAEMKNRGMKEVQINSKVAAVVLDILANSGTKYTDMVKEEEEESARLSELKNMVIALRHEADRCKYIIKKYEDGIASQKARWQEEQEYIDRFFEELQKCETPEGRDAMRRLQIYKNEVNIETKYDNTAHIVALGAILSTGAYSPMVELAKINPKIPEPPRQWMPVKRWNGMVMEEV